MCYLQLLSRYTCGASYILSCYMVESGAAASPAVMFYPWGSGSREPITSGERLLVYVHVKVLFQCYGPVEIGSCLSVQPVVMAVACSCTHVSLCYLCMRNCPGALGHRTPAQECFNYTWPGAN